MAGSELSTQVYTAPQAPDYLGHYADLLRSIPNYGLQFLAAQKAGTENQVALQQYELMKQKAKAFMELYPAFKQAQIAKLQAETASYPYRQDLLASQAAYQRAHAANITPPPGGTPSQFTGFTVPTVAPITSPAAAAPTAGGAPAPDSVLDREGPAPPPAVDPFNTAVANAGNFEGQ